MIQRYLLALAILCLSACSAVSPVTMPKTPAYTSAAESGTVFGSIGASVISGGITNWGLYFRRVGDTDAGLFSYIYSGLSDTPRDFSVGKTHGSVFSTALPAGEYEIFNVYYFQNMAQFGTRVYSAPQPFSVRFTVVPNKAVYLGQFMGYRTTAKNLFGIPITSGAYFVVGDALERDVDILAKRNVQIKLDDVNKTSSAFLQSGVPYFQSAIME
ncbi:hypothetical protein [Janthinobacterium sp.]|uniref:hypothetical protein n=1 Tax=Janthinobacterium sp. TaxID=1871054 RepID=UPI002609F3E6|nr:hypothetical protein [Janthinobacterium sp.]